MFSFFRSCKSAFILGENEVPGAYLTRLVHPLPGQFFKGAKSFIGTPEVQRIFVVKDELFCFMKNCMVSVAAINMIFEQGVYIQNWS